MPSSVGTCFPSQSLRPRVKQPHRAPLLGLAILALLVGLCGHASAQKVIYENAQPDLCSACSAFGERCCAKRSSVADCIKCGARYDLATQTRWCQTNQPVCAAKRK